MTPEDWIKQSIAESDRRISALHDERMRTNRKILFALPFLAVWLVIMAMIIFS